MMGGFTSDSAFSALLISPLKPAEILLFLWYALLKKHISHQL